MTEDGKKILEQIKADSAMEAYCLTIRRDATPGLLDSKFGGLAYWDSSLPYPTDPRGVPMQLLAQINFGAEDMDKPFPKAGLLQFFIGLDEMFGCNFAYAPDQKNYRVVYHPRSTKASPRRRRLAWGPPAWRTNSASWRTASRCFSRFSAYCRRASKIAWSWVSA